jgi:hypothetical protein
VIGKLLLGGALVGGGVLVYMSQRPGGIAAMVSGAIPDEEAWRRYSTSQAYTMLPAQLRPTRESFLQIWNSLSAEAKADAIRMMSMTTAQVQEEAARNPRFAASAQAMTTAMMSRAAGLTLPGGLRGIGGNYYPGR